MILTFTPQAWEDYLFWHRNDPEILKRIHDLMKEIQRSPFKGIGKPEPLKQNLSGYWSRRISDEHRIIYKKFDTGITYVHLRYHYRK